MSKYHCWFKHWAMEVYWRLSFSLYWWNCL